MNILDSKYATTTRGSTKCRRKECLRPYSEHASISELCPNGSGTAFQRRVSGPSIGASQSFTHREVAVANSLLKALRSGSDVTPYLRSPDLVSFEGKINVMQKKIQFKKATQR